MSWVPAEERCGVRDRAGGERECQLPWKHDGPHQQGTDEWETLAADAENQAKAWDEGYEAGAARRPRVELTARPNPYRAAIREAATPQDQP